MLRSNSFLSRSVKPIRMKASDIALLRNVFKELDPTKTYAVDLSDILLSIQQSGPMYDSLKSHCQMLRESLKRTSGKFSFLELMSLLCPETHPVELQNLVRQIAPSLCDAAAQIDTKVQEELDCIGEPRDVDGETKQARRVRLAVSRAVSKGMIRNSLTNNSPRLSDEPPANLKVTHKPIIRVSFQKRSAEAKRLMECSELRRPLLTMDGLPLHSHPSLQLTSGADDRKDDWLDERFVAIKRSNSNPSLGSRQGKMSVKLSRGEVISSPTKLTKPKTVSFYAHLFH